MSLESCKRVVKSPRIGSAGGPAAGAKSNRLRRAVTLRRPRFLTVQKHGPKVFVLITLHFGLAADRVVVEDHAITGNVER
jgi:hypothetical protein